MFKKIYWILDKIRSVAIIGMLGYIVILSFVQIVLRYFTSADLKPFAWGDEIIRLMAIWVGISGGQRGSKAGIPLKRTVFPGPFSLGVPDEDRQ